jgi:peroxiredoxin
VTQGSSRNYSDIGPAIGARFPDFRLPDQGGRLIDLHEARAGRPAVVVFYRSARW